MDFIASRYMSISIVELDDVNVVTEIRVFAEIKNKNNVSFAVWVFSFNHLNNLKDLILSILIYYIFFKLYCIVIYLFIFLTIKS